MALKAAIFDLDGTLVNSEPVSFRLYNEFLEPYGHELSLPVYAAEYSGHTLAANAQHVIEQFGLPTDADTVYRFFGEKRADAAEYEIPLKPGAERLLFWLRDHGITLALGSASTAERAFGYLDRLGVGNLFATAAYGAEVEHGKPAPDVFLLALERLGVAAHECVVFEDSEAGVLAGTAAGMRVFCTPDMAPVSAEAQAMAYANLSTIDEAIPLLEELLV